MRDNPQIPVLVDRTKAHSLWAGAAVFLTILCAPNIASPATLPTLSGKILGIVTDSTGVPQMGAAILLLNREDRLCDRILTDDKGAFSFEGLSAGVYSVRVSLTSFMPAARSNILVQPGLRTLLNVSLAGLFSSIQLVYPTLEQRAIMNDDWKWVLRTSTATRPVLRLLPDWNSTGHARRASSGTIFSDTRALVKVSAGDSGLATSFGNEADLGTAFALATSVLGRNQLQLSGNLGYASQTGAPSAGFSASYSRTGEADSTPMVTVVMRQMYVPGRALADVSSPKAVEPVLRAVTIGVKDATQLSDTLRLEYGFALDGIAFSERLGFFSPHARLIYSVSDTEQVEFSYTSGIPRADMFQGVSPLETNLQSDLSALALFPKISVRNSRARVQQAKNFEAGYHRKVGSRTFSAALFRESVSDAALMVSGVDGSYPSWDVLPDLFSNSAVFNAGGYRSLGYMASVGQNLGDNLKVEVMYSSGGALLANRAEIDSPNDLRSMIHTGRRRAVTSQIAGTVPGSGTKFNASYQWTDQRSITPAHFYATQRLRPEAGLNVQIRQPIPTFSLFPIRIEASADLRNLLAEGYLPFTLGDGRQVLLMHTPRTFRGGLSFIF